MKEAIIPCMLITIDSYFWEVWNDIHSGSIQLTLRIYT